MSDIVERLDEPEAHYPGNFDTPRRANAMLSCLCQEARDEIKTLRQQLAEKDAEIERLYRAIDDNWVSHKQIVVSQLLVKQLREKLTRIAEPVEGDAIPWGIAADAIALPQDTTALEAMIAKAGEVMRKRCLDKACGWIGIDEAIRALPGVTLEDLK